MAEVCRAHFPTDEGFFPSRPSASAAETMIHFYTKEFFGELARQLNADDEWVRGARDITLKIVCSAIDVKRSFLIDIKKGKVLTRGAPPNLKPDFKFEGTYETWMKLCKGEAEFDKLIQAGKIRFAGSMPVLMSMMGPLNRIVLTARRFPKEF